MRIGLLLMRARLFIQDKRYSIGPIGRKTPRAIFVILHWCAVELHALSLEPSVLACAPNTILQSTSSTEVLFTTFLFAKRPVRGTEIGNSQNLYTRKRYRWRSVEAVFSCSLATEEGWRSHSDIRVLADSLEQNLCSSRLTKISRPLS